MQKPQSIQTIIVSESGNALQKCMTAHNFLLLVVPLRRLAAPFFVYHHIAKLCFLSSRIDLQIQVEASGTLSVISTSDLALGIKQLRKVEAIPKSDAPSGTNPTPTAPPSAPKTSPAGMAGVISVADLQNASSRLKKVSQSISAPTPSEFIQRSS